MLAHDEQALFAARHQNVAALEEGIVAPAAAEARRVRANRYGVEEADLLGIEPVADVEHPEPALVIRLIDRVAHDIEIVVAGLVLGDVLAGEHRIVQLAHVPDQRAGAIHQTCLLYTSPSPRD